jgi:hypothetical protein
MPYPPVNGRWGAPPAAPEAPKPGIVPLRPLAVSEILDGAFAAIRRNPAATVGLSAGVYAVYGAIAGIVVGATAHASDTTRNVIEVVLVASYIVITAMLTGALSIVVSEATIGTEVTPGEVWRRVRPQGARLVQLSVVVTVLTAVGLIGFLVGAIWVWVTLSLATPVFVLEGAAIGTALRRSRYLIEGAWWRSFGVLLMAGIISVLAILVLAIPLAIIDRAAGTGILSGDANQSAAQLGAYEFVMDLLTGLATPITAGVTALLYVDRRIRVEGLDTTLAQAARERTAADSSPSAR